MHTLTLRFLAAAGSALALSACQTPPAAVSRTASPPTDPALVGEVRKGSGVLNGYLERKALPDSLALVNKPPADGSAQKAADLEAHRASRALRDTPRWTLAQRDSVLRFPAAAETFSCALGIAISEQDTPHLTMLLRRTLADAGLATYKAKDTYTRKRPFVELGESTCTPAEEASLAKDGSYPSGHASLGWAWGLVLAGLAPERADTLVQRGFAFGQSRMVCGVHWSSDVEAGRLVGSATVARLSADPLFHAQAALAKAEIAAARARGAAPTRTDCAMEAAALRP